MPATEHSPSLISRNFLPRAAVCAVSLLAAAVWAQPKPTLLHTPTQQAKANEALRIEGSLLGGSKIDRLVIHFRGPGEKWADAPMELQYGDLFRGYIPADRMVAPGVEYFIEGIGFDKSKVALFATAQKPHRVLITGGSSAPKDEDRTETSSGDEDPMLANDDTADEPPPKEKPSEDRTGAAKDSADEAFGDEPAPEDKRGKKKKGKDRGDKDVVASADEPAREEKQPEEKVPEARKIESRGDSSAPKKQRSELEEELLIYGAEDTVALATRHEERVTRVPAIATSLNRAQIRSLGARNVYEVLDYVPGLTVSRDVQGFYRVGIRGLRSDPEVLVLLNGHRLNNFFDGRALANLPIENLERIEVIRGPGPLLYGAGAFLGVVNIVTDTSDGVRAAAVAGSFGSVDGHVSGGGSFGDFHLFADADVNKQTGYTKEIPQDNLTSARQSQGLKDDLRVNDERLLINVGAGAEYANASLGKLRFSLRYMNEDRGALVGLFDVLGRDSRLKWSVFLADVDYERAISQTVTARARVYFDTQATDRLFQLTPKGFSPSNVALPEGSACAIPTCSPEGFRERSTVSTRTLGLDAAVEAALGESNRLTVGINAEHQSLPGYSYVTNYAGSNVALEGFKKPEGVVYPQENGKGAATRRLNLALYAQDQWTPVQRLSLTVGLRFDAIELPKVNENNEIVGSALVPSINPRAGVVLSVTDAWVLKLLYGRAFRAPTVQELTESIPETSLNQGRFAGNPSLRPATVDSVELGTDLVQSAGDARVRMRGDVFFENFLSPIARVDTTGNIVPLRNRLGVTTFGAEGEARLEASSRAYAFVNGAWFRAVDVETAEQAQLLTDTPQVRFNTGGTLPLGDWLNLDVNLRYGAERRNNSRSVLELVRRYKIPAYAVVSAQLRTEPLWDRVELALLAQNVFQAELYDDPPRPDRIPGLIPREGFAAFGILRGSF